jgi:hypothetical protein
LNALNLSSRYDIVNKLFDPVSVNGGTRLFKEKMNVNFGATLDPYALDNSGKRIEIYNINNGGSLFRLTSANMTLNYSLSSKSDKDKKEKNSQGQRNGGRGDDLFGVNQDLSDRRKSQFGEDDKEDQPFEGFYNAQLPWDLTIAYSVTYGNMSRQNEIIGNTIMLSGNLTLTPKWKLGASSGYDFVQKGVTFTQLRFERDLLSWRMDFNWVPFGDVTSWGFFIGVKAGVFSDIKWDKRKVPDNVVR